MLSRNRLILACGLSVCSWLVEEVAEQAAKAPPATRPSRGSSSSPSGRGPT
jgi:hypothetical protein